MGPLVIAPLYWVEPVIKFVGMDLRLLGDTKTQRVVIYQRLAGDSQTHLVQIIPVWLEAT